MTCRHPFLLALSIAAATLPGLATAQAFPNKPVRLVVPFAPGGTTDLLARIIAEKMGAALGSPYDPIKDFVHVSNVAATPNVIAVHPSFPAKDYKAFVDTLQKNPGKYSYGSAGNGSVGHMLVELYKSMAKVFVTHIPYRGSGPALNDVVAR